MARKATLDAMTKTLVIALVAVLVAGCAEYVKLLGQPDTWPHSTSWIDGRAVRTYHYSDHSTTFIPGKAPIRTYHYNAPRDPLGSVHQYRPDIYHGFYGPHGARP